MTKPCDKGPLLEQILEANREQHRKLDDISSALTVLAVQGERVTALEKKQDDQEERLRRIEDQPRQVLLWLGGIGSAVVTAGVIYYLGWGG